MFCLDVCFNIYADGARLQACLVILRDFLLIHGLDAETAELAAKALTECAGSRTLDRIQLDCRDGELRMTVHLDGAEGEDIVVPGINCSCLPVR